MKIVTIIGARPQIIKAAGLSRAIREHFRTDIEEVIVHTGQHYDQNMSEVFFEELGIPKPNINLNVGSGDHGDQTAKMITGIEKVLLIEQPHAIVLYGDTNSTLAGAIAASKIHVPIVHIEAGLRSFNKRMPEEINRIMCDHASTLLFTPTIAGVNNLKHEGFSMHNAAPYSINNPGVFHCGDIMYDNSLHFSRMSDDRSSILEKCQVTNERYVLCTIHRNDNTDHAEHLSGIFEAILEVIKLHHLEVILPLHPRTAKQMELVLSGDLRKRVEEESRLKMIEPVSFLDMIVLEKHARLIMTDSGGVQKEAFFFEKPCVILRPETEWVELVECGAAQVVAWSTERIVQAVNHYLHTDELEFPSIFGNGRAGRFICEKMLESLG